MLTEIRFIATTPHGPHDVGGAVLRADGTVRLSGLPKRLADDLRFNGVLDARRRRVRLTDGRSFLRACVFQFSGSYLRARVVRT
ncbi:MAG TPA: hypothetical protein VNR20_02850 [Terriglobales bacterium]|nr:hypothetical protein [Terriglobales bacterium]